MKPNMRRGAFLGSTCKPLSHHMAMFWSHSEPPHLIQQNNFLASLGWLWTIPLPIQYPATGGKWCPTSKQDTHSFVDRDVSTSAVSAPIPVARVLLPYSRCGVLLVPQIMSSGTATYVWIGIVSDSHGNHELHLRRVGPLLGAPPCKWEAICKELADLPRRSRKSKPFQTCTCCTGETDPNLPIMVYGRSTLRRQIIVT